MPTCCIYWILIIKWLTLSHISTMLLRCTLSQLQTQTLWNPSSAAGGAEKMVHLSTISKQPSWETWTMTHLNTELTINLGMTINKATHDNYSSVLNSYLTFCRVGSTASILNLPLELLHFLLPPNLPTSIPTQLTLISLYCKSTGNPLSQCLCCT